MSFISFFFAQTIWALAAAREVPYTYSGVFMSYCPAELAASLAKYARMNGLTGAIMWEMSGDAPYNDTKNSLIRQMSSHMRLRGDGDLKWLSSSSSNKYYARGSANSDGMSGFKRNRKELKFDPMRLSHYQTIEHRDISIMVYWFGRGISADQYPVPGSLDDSGSLQYNDEFMALLFDL